MPHETGFVALFVCLLLWGFASTASAALIEYPSAPGLLYDEELDITWIKNLSNSNQGLLHTWMGAKNWAQDLEIESGGIVYSDFRLPTLWEMEFLHNYHGFGQNNPGPFDLFEYIPIPEIFAGDGSRIIYHPVFTGTLEPFDPDICYIISSDVFPPTAAQVETLDIWLHMQPLQHGHDTWGAVFDGPPTVIPIPGAVWLLGSGMLALVGLRKKLKK